MILLTWKGEDLMMGAWRVGTVFYDFTVSKDDKKVFAAVNFLPGLRSTLGHFESKNDAMNRVSDAVTLWLKKAEVE